MERIEKFVDNRQKSWCIHCSRPLTELEATEDHVPTKSLLHRPRPHNLPVVTICRDCNNGFALDEQYAVTLLSCVLAGSTDPEKQSNTSAARALSKSVALRAMIERSKRELPAAGGETRIIWQPDVDRIHRVVLKKRARPCLLRIWRTEDGSSVLVWSSPLESMAEHERQEFDGRGAAGGFASWPEVGSRMMTRIATGLDMDGGWVVVQDGIYRYGVDHTDGLRVRSIVWEYLATEVIWEG